jgi:hypothetical protein
MSFWREPTTGAFSCNENPGDFSCDNAPLFTSHAYKLGLIDRTEYHRIVEQYFLEGRGWLLRYPLKLDYQSWDDFTGVSAVSPTFAARILDEMHWSDWRLPNGDWLGRFPILEPVVRGSAGAKLSLLNQVRVAVAYLANCFEKSQETSGKLILWLAEGALRDAGWIANTAILIWQVSIVLRYPRGIQDCYGIYFPPNHPFNDPSVWKNRSWITGF